MEKMTRLEAAFGLSAMGIFAGIVFCFGLVIWKLSESLMDFLF
ncbi:MAG: hypothetical protein ACOYS2_01440 [Patescibacteria group bacterium]